MKRVGLLILVLLLLVDSAENGYLGKVTVCLPYPSAKTSVTSSSDYPGSGQSDSGHELASPNLPGNPRHGDGRSVSFFFITPILRIMHCCHISSAGGLPM
jgi:hypothetical protein